MFPTMHRTQLIISLSGSIGFAINWLVPTLHFELGKDTTNGTTFVCKFYNNIVSPFPLWNI